MKENEITSEEKFKKKQQIDEMKRTKRGGEKQGEGK